MKKGADKSYIALTLSTVEASRISQLPARKSLRRSWNQLPRCQRNLILLAVLTFGATLFILLPSKFFFTRKKNFFTFSLYHWEDNRGKETFSNDLNDEKLTSIFQDGVQKTLGNRKDKDRDNESLLVEKFIVPKLNGDNARKTSEWLQERSVENIVNLSVTQQLNLLENIIKTQEGQINDNNIESLVVEPTSTVNDVRSTIELIVQYPFNIPSKIDVTINEYLKQLDTVETQKHHFHGATNERQEAVVAAFRHSWNGYKKYAWGHDNLKPISQTSHDWFGLGLTLIDSLDTMYIMGLDDEFIEARNWVNEFLKFDINRDVNLFETTIRILGGLLSSYHLSGDKIFLKKSIELGNRLLPCFLSPSGIPYSDVNLVSMLAHSPKWSPDSSTSEVTTIQLEFRDLSRSSSIPIYEKVISIVNEKVHDLKKTSGLVPIFINANSGTFRSYSTISLGARGDSYYEYLLKQWLQTGCKENDILIKDYKNAIGGVLTQLMRRTPKEHHVYIGELINGKDFKPKMDHLTCYLPGTLLLGHKYGMENSHLLLARDLLETCYQMYMQQPTHLAPEISYFALDENEESEIYVKPNDAHNLLRPEFVESLYYFYALTGNHTYQDMGWNIFQAFERHTKVAYGYTSIGNVKNVFNARLRDMMESFWLGETLKYFYLLFSDNRKEIDLEKWIFNTEAHPLPIRNY